MNEPRDQELLKINQAMLNSAATGDWKTYSQFCSPELSCFEPETNGNLVEGLDFHHFYFSDIQNNYSPSANASLVVVTMVRPHLRWIGEDTVVLSYCRLTQRMQNGQPITTSCTETRIWQCQDGNWQQIHLHRS
jgi:calcium/calmodulin-dependent protein kinase (CaM kinase) II